MWIILYKSSGFSVVTANPRVFADKERAAEFAKALNCYDWKLVEVSEAISYFR